ncbi:MAG: PAS domain S-box protein, partial [Chloroflexota bacterium]
MLTVRGGIARMAAARREDRTTNTKDRAPSTAAGLEHRRAEPDPVPIASARRGSSIAERALAARLYETFDKDLVYRYRLAPTRGFDYLSPSCLAMTGYAPDDFYADSELIYRVVHPDDVELIRSMRNVGQQEAQIIRWTRKDGSALWTENRNTVILGSNGSPVAIEGIFKDVSDVSSARELLAMLERSGRRFVANAPDLAVLLDPLGRVVYANDAFLALTGWTAEQVNLKRWSSTFLHPDDLRAGKGLLNTVEDGPGETTAPLLLRDGRRREVHWATLAIPDPRVRRPSVVALGKDLTAEDEKALELAQLRTAIEETTDSVVVTDASSIIRAVNPAFERITGYQKNQAIGQNPRILQSGHQTAAFYKAMWWVLTHGYVWRGELVNRKADGGILVEEVSITPIRDRAGAIQAYVGVNRDVTRLRELRGNLDDVHRQRERLADAIDRLSVGDSPDSTADGIAAMLSELPNVVATAVGVVDAEGAGHYAASRGMGQLGYAKGEPLGAAVIARLARHDFEPWVEASHGNPSRARMAALRKAGLGSIVHIPVYKGSLPLGIIVVCGSEPQGEDMLSQMSSFNEVAAVMRALLGPEASSRQARQDARNRLSKTIAETGFETVFQPIVDLLNGRRAGFEALTRFADGTPPALMFAGARACDMQKELELATLRSALIASEELPDDTWLSLNLSSSLLIGEPGLADLLSTSNREIVIEIVDTIGVEEGQAARNALRGMNITARLAVDDSGDGAVKPRHLVEMRPDFVKLDISLIRDLDMDSHRQQLVHGLKAFAHAAGGVLIAEGIESHSERDALA